MEVCSPVKVSGLSGFLCAQEIADEKNKPQKQHVTQHYSVTFGYLHLITIQDMNYSVRIHRFTYFNILIKLVYHM